MSTLPRSPGGVTPGQAEAIADSVAASGQWGQITPGSSATTMSGAGILAGNTLATDASRSAAVDAYGRSFTQGSSAVIGNNAGWASSDPHTRMDVPSRTIWNVQVPTVTQIRWFCGLTTSQSIAVGVDADTLGAPGIGFGWSSDRGDTEIQIVAFNGTSQSRASTGVALTAGTFFSFELQLVSSTSVTWKIYDATGVCLATGTVTSNLPASTSTFYAMHCCEPRSAAVRQVVTYSVAAINRGYRR